MTKRDFPPRNKTSGFVRSILAALVFAGLLVVFPQDRAFAQIAGDPCTLTDTQIRGLEVIGKANLVCNGTTLDTYESVAVSPLRKGIFTVSPEATLDVNGEVRIGNTSIACSATNAGATRYFGGYIQWCNGTSWQNVGTGSASTSLSTITAAAADNTIANAAWNQVWNWALTAATEDAFTFGETTAATGGSGDQSVLKATAMAASTAIPLLVNNAGAGVSFKVTDDGTDTDTTPFVVDAAGQVGIGTAGPASALDVNGGVKIANDAASCVAGKAGTLRYTGGTPKWEYCNGSAWVPFEQAGPAGCAGPADCPAVGNICTDGTVFAGCAPPLHDTPFFVTRCDAGLTTTTTACDTGARATQTWNNGNSTGFVTTNVTGVTDGSANTATLQVGGAQQDSDSGVGGVQPHIAADYCATLSIHGKTNWYLPSRAELYLMWVNAAAINAGDAIGASDFIASTFWSSSEYVGNFAWVQNFSIGNQFNNIKNNVFYVRCARR